MNLLKSCGILFRKCPRYFFDLFGIHSIFFYDHIVLSIVLFSENPKSTTMPAVRMMLEAVWVAVAQVQDRGPWAGDQAAIVGLSNKEAPPVTCLPVRGDLDRAETISIRITL